MRNPTVRLSFPHVNPSSTKDGDRLFRVEQTIGTIDYVPGQILDRAVVKRMLNLSDLRVVVVSPPVERPRPGKHSGGVDFADIDNARRRALKRGL